MREQEIYLDLEENLERLITGVSRGDEGYHRRLGMEDSLKVVIERLNSERKRKLRETMGTIRESIAS